MKLLKYIKEIFLVSYNPNHAYNTTLYVSSRFKNNFIPETKEEFFYLIKNVKVWNIWARTQINNFYKDDQTLDTRWWSIYDKFGDGNVTNWNYKIENTVFYNLI